jgi:hypothetical protein
MNQANVVQGKQKNTRRTTRPVVALEQDVPMAHFLKGDAMFWGFLIFAGLAFVFAQLGAMSVWLTVLKGGLMLALLIVVVMAILLLWRKVF